MEKIKEQGITLVTLVVTIVVLLILAGVSINLVLGQNGLITQAKNAKAKSASALNEENYLINSYIPNYIEEQTDKESNENTADDEEDGSVIKIGNTTEYTATGNGKMLNWRYTNFLKEVLEGITYTVEFLEDYADYDINYTQNTLIITNASALSKVPDMKVIVKASNGEEKVVSLTGGEIK